MQHSHRPPHLDARVRAAWQTQLEAAVHTPGLLPELVRRRAELLPRFVAYYTQLQGLPRRVRRTLQRQWRLSLAGVALMLALGQAPVHAALIPVRAGCTLVDAITAANTDTATGGCPAGSGADTLVLPAGSTQTLSEVNNSTYGPTGLPVIRSVITLEGQGSMIVRDSGAPKFRIVAVNSTGELTLQETTVSGGETAESGPPPGGGPFGGGVANYGGTLTMTSSTISGNSAYFYGGGVANIEGTLTLTNSTVSGNYADYRGGGGVANIGGTVTVTTSTISGNRSGGDGGDGGGVANIGGTVTLINSTISDNSVFYGGGGVANIGGTVTVTTSTISGNRAFEDGGGGVSNSGTLTVTNSTITGNRGGPYYRYGGGGVSNSGTLTLAHTLVAGNTAAIGPEITNSGTVLADNHNLFGVDGNAGVEGFSLGPTDVVPGDGILLADILDPTLANHGGPTQTHALVPGSPAIDAGDSVCRDATGAELTTDQRGKPRLVDGNSDGTAACDIGAFEFFPVVNDFVALDPALATAFDPAPVPGGPAGTFTITATFTNTSDTPLRFPFFGVTELSGAGVLLNADGEPSGVGATLTPEVAGEVLAPGAAVTVEFVLGLQEKEPFRFFVNLFGEPLL